LPVRLLFVGDGPYLKQLRQMAPDACYTGYLKGRELGSAYASSDVFIFPSTTDTFGNVVLEAQAAGLPCVVSDQGGPAELVVHGIDGFITRSLNVDAFADAIRKLAADPELRLKMGERARQRVQDRNWANAFRQFWNH
jgi:glycosyltransferase involved in cell wall biosynthesis